MSATASSDRLTTYSDSDAAFTSCTALSIHQTTLSLEEMAGIEGMCDLGEVVSETLTYIFGEPEKEEEDSPIPIPPSEQDIIYYIVSGLRKSQTPLSFSSMGF